MLTYLRIVGVVTNDSSDGGDVALDEHDLDAPGVTATERIKSLLSQVLSVSVAVCSLRHFV
jgi:hypothetical protein